MCVLLALLLTASDVRYRAATLDVILFLYPRANASSTDPGYGFSTIMLMMMILRIVGNPRIAWDTGVVELVRSDDK